MERHYYSKITDRFPDAYKLKYGEWSEYAEVIHTGIGKNNRFEIGLYREPLSNTDYSGHLTLQGFRGDTVIFCEDIGSIPEQKNKK